jgi:hypothetical protein
MRSALTVVVLLLFILEVVIVLLHQCIDVMMIRPVTALVLSNRERGMLLRDSSFSEVSRPPGAARRTCAWASHSATVQRPIKKNWVMKKKEKGNQSKSTHGLWWFK